MSKNIFFSEYFNSINEAIQSLDCSLLERVSRLIDSCKEGKIKLIIVGNGGSSAIASHVAVDFTKAAKIRAINFNEADLITCFANDYGYGKGRYMGDSVELQGNKIDELSPATLSSYKKAAGQSASNLDKSADKEFALGNKTAGVALTNKANKRFSGIVRATKKQ